MLSRIFFVIFWLAKAALLGLGLIVLSAACFGYYCGVKAATADTHYAREDDSCSTE